MNSNSSALVSVIIVTIGAKGYLWRCLESVKAQSYANLEIIVIDNSLNADLLARIRQDFAFVKLYSSSANLYYGVALNKGLELSQGEFILCLNDDVFLDNNFIQEALAGFLINFEIGLVSGKILREDRKTLDSTGLFLSVWRTAKERGYGRPDLGQFDKSGFIFGASGAAALYKKEMLEAVKKDGNYFDPDFRMFYEDLDISWRAQKKGWSAYYISTALAYHVRGGSFRPDAGLDKPIARKYLNDQLHYDLIKNRYLTIWRNETFFGFILHFIPILIYDLCVWSYVILLRPGVIRVCLSRFFGRIKDKRF